MKNDIEIHLARQSEIEPARKLSNRSWIRTYSPLIGEEMTREIIEDRHSSSRFAEQANDKDTLFWVAVAGRKVVGHCYAFRKDGLYVDRLPVDPTRKRSGIGRAMLKVAEEQRGPDERIWLDVLAGNDAACSFYEKVGYVRTGETDACGGLNGIPAIIFEKKE